MRNDARPIGEHAPESPLGGDHAPQGHEPDHRDSVTHGRRSHIVNRDAEERQPDSPHDPVMPSSDSSRNTRI